MGLSALRRAAATQGRRRVLIVDDSAVARAALARMLDATGRYAAVATVGDAEAGLAALRQGAVDAILLDLDMPHRSGIEALPALLAAGRGAPVLIVSGLAARGAAVTVEALALGAADTLVKPGAGFDQSFAATLADRLDAMLARPEMPAAPPPRGPAPLRPFDAIAIGASTGGIHALAALLGALPSTLAQPIFVTQHLPGAFSDVFSQVLAGAAGRRARVAGAATRVEPGTILVAPGDAHLVLRSSGGGAVAARLSTAPTASGNVPSVDPMFVSLSAIYGERLLAVVLSGMGRDGLDGARAVVAAGGTVLVQDRASCVVWGMPGVVAEAGLAHAELPPTELGALIAEGARA